MVLAFYRGCTSCARLLLSRACDPNLVDGCGMTALALAAHAGNVDCLKLCLEYGSDPNVREADADETVSTATATFMPPHLP